MNYTPPDVKDSNAETASSPQVKPVSADFLEILLVLAREKKFLLTFTLIATALIAAIVFLLPNTYTATASILPPQQNQSVLSAMLGQFAGAQSLDLRDVGLKNPSDVFVLMLKSRTVEDALVNRFDLRKVYWVKRYQDARKKLESRSEIESGEEGLVSIAVTDRDPRRAADIANAWVEELAVLNQGLAFTEAARRRIFFEQKLAAERVDLSKAELALKQIQQKTGLIQPDAQTRALIGGVADLRAQIAAKEVQLQSMRTFATANNPDVIRTERELAELRAQLARLSRTQSAVPVDADGNLQVPTGRVAGAGIEYLQAARELRYHESLYDFLNHELEAAHIDEAKNAVVVQVVDKAVVPEKKSGPKRMLIVGLTAMAAFVFAAFFVLLREALRRERQDPAEAVRLDRLSRYLREPL